MEGWVGIPYRGGGEEEKENYEFHQELLVPLSYMNITALPKS